jgi:hypothetical protein
VHVGSSLVLAVYCKDLEFQSHYMVTKFSYYASSSCTCKPEFGTIGPRDSLYKKKEF